MAMNTPTPAERRARRMKAIFAASRANSIDEGTRKQLVKTLTGRDSLTDCTMLQLGDVLDHLNRGKAGYAGRKRPQPAPVRAPLLAKIDALLAELHRVTGQVHTLKYADAIAKRNGWAECVDFADPAALRNIVVALNRTLQFKVAGR
ncbi:MAG: phage protein GemA/Gp16 family protein [Rhodocyclaceae bacterium]